MWESIKEMLASKKFKVMMAAILAAVGAGVSGAQTWQTVVLEIVGAAVAYIFAQGIADAGKERAKYENGYAG